jgi:cytochrome c
VKSRALILLTCVALGCTAARADERGRVLFEPCRACHTLDPAAEAMAGPNLAGLLGRRVGGDPGFDYSPVLREAAAEGRTWSRESLDRFLADPLGMFPAMWMTARGVADPGDRAALLRFLTEPASR